jgi:hypothetical protein
VVDVMTVELELDGSTRPPTSEEHRTIERIAAMLRAQTLGWNRLTWRPPLSGTALVLKASCTSCETQGLPILVPSAPPNDAGLRAHIAKLGTHSCETG